MIFLGSLVLQTDLLSLLFVCVLIFFVLIYLFDYCVVSVHFDQRWSIAILIKNEFEFIVMQSIFGDAVLVSGGVVQRRRYNWI